MSAHAADSRAAGSAVGISELAIELTDALASSRGLELSLRVGRAIAEHLYEGDPSAWRLRSPKEMSLRRLIAAADLPITPAALCRALGVYEVWSVAAEGRPWSNLSAAHYRAVLGVPLPTQRRLLEEAWRDSIPATELRRRVKARAERMHPRGGRLPAHPVARLVERVERELSLTRRRGRPPRIADLPSDNARQLAARCERLVLRLDELAARLRERGGED